MRIKHSLAISNRKGQLSFSRAVVSRSRTCVSRARVIRITISRIGGRSLGPHSPCLNLHGFRIHSRRLFFNHSHDVTVLRRQLRRRFLLILKTSNDNGSSLVQTKLVTGLTRRQNDNFQRLVFAPSHGPFRSYHTDLDRTNCHRSRARFLLANRPNNLLRTTRALGRSSRR